MDEYELINEKQLNLPGFNHCFSRFYTIFEQYA